MKYSSEEIIELYKDFAKTLNKTPTQVDVLNKSREDKNFPNNSCINKNFGGLNKLNIICGLKPNSYHYTDEYLLSLLKEYNDKFGYPTSAEIEKYFKINRNLYCDRFGSYKNALKLVNIEYNENLSKDYTKFDNCSDDELLNLFYDYYIKHGIPKASDVKFNRDIPSLETYRKKFGSMKNVFEILKINIPESRKKNYSEFKKISNEKMLQILKDYSINIGFPTQRKFKYNNNLPSAGMYYDRFGSFRNAIILADIEIPQERKKWFDRNSLTDEELLKLLEYFNNKKLEDDPDAYLLTREEINNNKQMPSISVYNSRFGGIIEAFNKININYDEFNNIALEKDMIKKYKELFKLLGKTPNSRDIDEYSRHRIGFYSMKCYDNHFGGIYKLQMYCDMSPTIIGRHKTRQELIDDLQELYGKLNRLPTLRDLSICEWTASPAKYVDEFGSYSEALKIAQITDNIQDSKHSITPQGNLCRSSYEYDFCTMLEDYCIEFSQEDYYKDYIKDFDRKFRFDYKIKYNNQIYFIEIFGIMEYKWYREKTEYKKQLCKDNNLILIDLYKEDFKSHSKSDLYKLLIKKIK